MALVQKSIAVSPPEGLSVNESLFKALGEIFNVRFQGCGGEIGEKADAEILFIKDRRSATQTACVGVPRLAFVTSSVRHGESVSEVNFPDGNHAPFGFRDISLLVVNNTHAAPWIFEGGDQVIAKAKDHAIWVRDRKSGLELDIVGFSPPELNNGQSLREHFSGERFLQLLPLFDFLRRLTLDQEWKRPAPRACFMFDDPNLHWPSYGFIGYQRLIERAKLNNYHVSFATVPLDAWLVHRPTAELFRENASWVSFLVHGNNHTLQELARRGAREDDVALLRQALNRVERVESRAGFEISKVMAAPHGACTEQMLEAMQAVDFEAACISSGSLREHNAGRVWPAWFGLKPAEITGKGFPVIPRFRLSANCHNNVALAAYLGQPIIPVGHHNDVADGLDLLDEIAKFINAFGGVQWGDMKFVSRSNFELKREASVLRMRPYTRRMELNVPDGVDELIVEPVPGMEWESDELNCWNGDGKNLQPIRLQTGFAVKTYGARRLNLRLAQTGTGQQLASALPPVRLWPIARRLLAELRDRMLPAVYPLMKRFRRAA